MDFFAHQDRARANSRKLLALYALALVCIVVALNVIAFGIYALIDRTRDTRSALDQVDASVRLNAIENMNKLPGWWQPQVYGITTVITLAIIGLATLYKQAAVGGDGAKVAEMLGGRPVDKSSADPAIRQLLNVVEEMSIASGVAVPRVFVLDNEKAINAFAAGTRPGDAVIGVTRGCIERLNRDQLQGVIAHEFSHILNGDMRLNIRLLTLNFGIMAVATIGYYIMRFAPRSGGRGREGGAAIVVILLAGLGMLIVGSIGLLFGRILQAAISRQREFLADASAVQFTRNPNGIAGALAIIGNRGSLVATPEASEVAHMFFATGFSSLFATHPPIDERIRRINPNFKLDASSLQRQADFRSKPSPARLAVAPADWIAASGLVSEPAIEHAAETIGRIDAQLTAAAGDPYLARSLVLALLVDSNAQTRRVQMELLSRDASPLAQEALRLLPRTQTLPPEQKLPLLDLAIPTLKRLSPTQRAELREVAWKLIEADGRLSGFELALSQVLEHEVLSPSVNKLAPPRFLSVRAVAPAARVLIATIAAASSDPTGAYLRGVSLLEIDPGDGVETSIAAFVDALHAMRQASPGVRRRVVEAAIETIRQDGTISLGEAELLRATCAAFDVPMPPLPAVAS